MSFESLVGTNLAFNNMVSGPAPAGRMLNYIIMAGKEELKYKAGKRQTGLENGYGDAWCIDLMYGLGLFVQNESMDVVKLSSDGKRIYELIKDHNPDFNEKTNSNALRECREKLYEYSKEAYDLFYKVFKESKVFKNLCIQLSKYLKIDIGDFGVFKQKYFGDLKQFYTNESYEPNSKTANTDDNRMASLFQLCEFFEMFDKNNISFDILKVFKNEGIKNTVDEKQSIIETRFKRNRIIFGAPGTGKSYKLNEEKNELISKNKEIEANPLQYERVTFHPDYTYANFVGTYKPVMVSKSDKNLLDDESKNVLSILTDDSKSAQEKYDKLYDKFKDGGLTRLATLIGICNDDDFNKKDKDGEQSDDKKIWQNCGHNIRKYVNLKNINRKINDISYEYVPGPFMRLFVKALKNQDNNHKYLLIIEEINRANVSAVFGDLFQLLDRDDNGESMYPVEATEDIKKYLAKEGIYLPDNKIRIPNNMFIWATMNSADQGVFPMDTAFKRRWDFDYIGINDNDDEIKDKCFNIEVVNKNEHSQLVPIYWNDIRKAINNYLSSKKINEDKQLGPYFISKKVLFSKDNKEFLSTFKNKVIMYLFDDAAKQKRPELFNGASDKKYDSNRYSSICECFDKYGLEIFNGEIINEYINLVAGRENENKK